MNRHWAQTIAWLEGEINRLNALPGAHLIAEEIGRLEGELRRLKREHGKGSDETSKQ